MSAGAIAFDLVQGFEDECVRLPTVTLLPVKALRHNVKARPRKCAPQQASIATTQDGSSAANATRRSRVIFRRRMLDEPAMAA